MEYDGIPYRVIAPDAEIGEGTTIMPFAVIGSGVKIGKNCYIGTGCSVNAGVIIGEGTCVSSNVTVGASVLIGGNVFIGDGCSIGVFRSMERAVTDADVECGFVELHDNVTIEPRCVIEYGFTKEEPTVIDTDTTLCVGCYVKAGTFIGKDCTLSPYCYVGNKARLEGKNRFTAQIIIGERTVLEHGVCGINRYLFKNDTTYKRHQKIDTSRNNDDYGKLYCYPKFDTFYKKDK